MATNISKKRKFIADGVFYAELNELLTRELAEDGYSGVEVRQTPMRTEIIIRATRTQNVLVQKRFSFPPETVELYAEKVANRGLCAVAQAESLRYKLLGGLAVRRMYLDTAVRHVLLRQGVLGIKIMKDWDPTGRQGPKEPLPDVVKVHEPKEEEHTGDKLYAGKEEI
eukprot:gene13582-13707_t